MRKQKHETEEEEAVGGACSRWLTDGGIDLIIVRYEVTGDVDVTDKHRNTSIKL